MLAALRSPLALAAVLTAVWPGAGPAPARGHAAHVDSILYVGDSLGVGTFPNLRSMLAGVAVEADVEIGRASPEGLSVLRERLDHGHDVVIFDLGTNDGDPGTLTDSLERARAAAGGRLMIVFTLNRPGIEPLNRAVRSFARSSHDVALIPWHRIAATGHLLAGDGVHASAAGYRRRAALVHERIAGWRKMEVFHRKRSASAG